MRERLRRSVSIQKASSWLCSSASLFPFQDLATSPLRSCLHLQSSHRSPGDRGAAAAADALRLRSHRCLAAGTQARCLRESLWGPSFGMGERLGGIEDWNRELTWEGWKRTDSQVVTPHPLSFAESGTVEFWDKPPRVSNQIHVILPELNTYTSFESPIFFPNQWWPVVNVGSQQGLTLLRV